jgi:hypothetical protein
MRIKWRQDKVLELCSKGHNQSEIARILQVGIATISRDVHYIQQDLYNKRKEFGEQIFAEYQKSGLYPKRCCLTCIVKSINDICAKHISNNFFFFMKLK